MAVKSSLSPLSGLASIRGPSFLLCLPPWVSPARRSRDKGPHNGGRMVYPARVSAQFLAPKHYWPHKEHP